MSSGIETFGLSGLGVGAVSDGRGLWGGLGEETGGCGLSGVGVVVEEEGGGILEESEPILLNVGV